MDAPQLFLSYNSTDRDVVRQMQQLLRARGITTFLDRDNLVTGLPWPQALEQALRGARAVAVFIGRQLGGWQKREMWYALDRQVSEEKQGRAFPVIPVLLSGADLTPGFLFSNTWIDLRSGVVDGAATAEAIDAFEGAINATAPTPAPATAEERAAVLCPYRGLQAFREEDSAFFAGRSAFAKQLLDFTLGKDLVAVVGPSGSGKSSVVQAGLLPLLRRERPPARTWDTVSFTPGSDPFHRLASALIPLLEPELSETDRLSEAQKVGGRLASGAARLEAVIDRVIEKSNGTGRLLVVADQFEELFTITPEPSRRQFAQVLLQALGGAPFTLLLTLRADFYSQIITLDRDLSDRIASAQVNIGALTADELRESIASPARLVGLDFEPGLADRILGDAGCEPGSLPLVQFALTELWSRRRDRTLTNAAYNETGGVTGALAKRAETEFARFTQEEQAAARRLFSRLVRVARPEEGSEDTRQRLELQATDAVTEKVAQALTRPEVRLLVTGRDDQTGSQTVEVAHEALIRNWERLRGWLNEDREFLLWQQRVRTEAKEWERKGRDSDLLPRGRALTEAEKWLVARPQDLAALERRFISEAERRRARRLRRFASGVVLLAIAGTGLALWQRGVARARQLVATSISAESDDPELSVLIAAQSVAATWHPAHTVLPEAEQQLHHAIMASVWGAGTGKELLTLSGHRGPVASVAWSPDGKRLATASADNTAKVWDAETGKQVLSLSGHSGSVDSVAWSPNGKRLATSSGDDTAKVWDAETGKDLLTLRGHSHQVLSVAWRPDGKRLATGSWDNTAKVWDTETGKELLSLSGHSNFVSSVAWSPDGEGLATGSWDNTAKVWDAKTGKEALTLSGHGDHVSSVAWSPDGKRLATGSENNTAAKVWDAATGKEVLTLRGHIDPVSSVAWSPDGRRLATGSFDKTAKVWDAAETGKQLLTLRGHMAPVLGVAWSPDGKRLATGSGDSTVQIYAMDIRDLMALARQRVTAHPSEEACRKYLNVDKCPPVPQLSFWY